MSVQATHCEGSIVSVEMARRDDKILILFDDVDVQLETDPSMLLPLAKLIATSKVVLNVPCMVHLLL